MVPESLRYCLASIVVAGYNGWRYNAQPQVASHRMRKFDHPHPILLGNRFDILKVAAPSGVLSQPLSFRECRRSIRSKKCAMDSLICRKRYTLGLV